MDGPLLGEREFDSPRNGVEALVAPSSMMWIAMKSASGVLGREASDIDNVDLKTDRSGSRPIRAHTLGTGRTEPCGLARQRPAFSLLRTPSEHSSPTWGNPPNCSGGLEVPGSNPGAPTETKRDWPPGLPPKLLLYVAG